MLELLFENIKLYGRYVRTNRLDGLEYWNRVKHFIQSPEQIKGSREIDDVISSSRWNINVKINSSRNSNVEEIYNYVHGDKENQLRIFGEEGDNISKSLEHNVWEQYHFFLQLIRIPKNNPTINLLRLLQIAYNLGQLSVCLENVNCVINPQAQKYFKSNNLDRLDSYIKINNSQKNLLETKLAITDFITNINSFILEQMNVIKIGGNSINSVNSEYSEYKRGSNDKILEPFYTKNVEELTKTNNAYRRVIYTGKSQQFVLMSIPPEDTIKMEIHENHDQFIRIEKGEGEAKIGNTTYKLEDDSAFIIPAGIQHQIINTSKTTPLKLYTIYSPPEHPDKLVQNTNPDKFNLQELNIDDTKKEYIMPKIINEELKKIYYENKYNKYKNKYIRLKNIV